MKIRRIFIRNLNSLAGDNLIDFSEAPLSEAALFAITGPTGAGKSSILDAICLALYDKSPRLNQANKNYLVKTGAIITKGKLDCKVQVEYTQDGTRYRSEWEIKTNRNGNLNERSMALDEWKEELNAFQTIQSGHQAVPEKNAQLTGLDYHQFTKSILLAQGEFARLLSAKKEERYALMEKITGNHSYRKIGIRIFQIARSKSQQIENLELETKGVKLLEESQIQELQLNQNNLKKKSEEFDKRIGLLVDDINRLNTYLNKQKELSELLPRLEKWKEKYAKSEGKFEQLKTHRLLLPLANDLFEWERNKQQQVALNEFIQKLIEERTRLNHSLEKRQQEWEEKLNKKFEKDNFQKELDHELQHIAKIQEEWKDWDKQLNSLVKEIELKNQALKKLESNLAQSKESLHAEKIRKEKNSSAIQLLEPFKERFLQKENLFEKAKGLKQFPLDFKVLFPNSLDNQSADAYENTLEQELKTIRLKLEEFKKIGDNATLQTELIQTNREEQLLHKLSENLRQLKLKNDELIQTKKDYAELEERNKICLLEEPKLRSKKEQLEEEKRLISLKQQVLDAKEQLKLLRTHLKDGEACPLCGSEEHPGVKHEPSPLHDLIVIHEKGQKSYEKEWNEFLRISSSLKTSLEKTEQTLAKFTADINLIQKEIEQTLPMLNNVGEASIDSIESLLKNAQSKRLLIEANLSKLIDQPALQLKEKEIEQLQKGFISWKETLIYLTKQLGIESPNFNLNELREPFLQLKSDFEKWEQLQKEQKEIDLLLVAQESDNTNLEKLYNSALLELKEYQRQYAELEEKAAPAKHAFEKAPKIEQPQEQRIEANRFMESALSLLNNNAQNLTELEQKKSTQSTKFEELELAINQKLRALKFNHPEEALVKILPHEQLSLLEGEEKELEQEGRDLNLKKASLEKEIATQLEMIPEERNQDLLQEKLELEKEQLNLLNRQIGELQAQLKADQDAKVSLSEKLKEIETLKQKANPYFKLRDLIGDSEGKKFNEYAQELTLRRLLLSANSNLQQLNPRYELDMHLESEQDESLYIIDHDMGESRRAANVTLSGGESFLVSLALALGLSDLAAGKAELGNLFIDEGFGSLDPDSLERAIGMLEELQHKRGRTIGLISHVAELKERILTQIRVEKKPGGISEIQVC